MWSKSLLQGINKTNTQENSVSDDVVLIEIIDELTSCELWEDELASVISDSLQRSLLTYTDLCRLTQISFSLHKSVSAYRWLYWFTKTSVWLIHIFISLHKSLSVYINHYQLTQTCQLTQTFVSLHISLSAYINLYRLLEVSLCLCRSLSPHTNLFQLT